MDTVNQESRNMLKGITVQLVPFNSTHWEYIAKWFFNSDYSHMFRQFTRVLNEEEFKQYPRVINGEVFMIGNLSDNSIIGMIQIIPDYKKNKAFFLGTVVDKEHQGKHIPMESTWLLLDYAFNRQGYNKVILEILEEDESLKKTVDKTGFYREGKLLQECFMNGKYVNELRYSMTAYYFNKNKDKYLKEYNIWVDSLKISSK